MGDTARLDKGVSTRFAEGMVVRAGGRSDDRREDGGEP